MFDRDGRRNAADLVHPWLVHPVKELPHIRTEGFDVPTLAFRVDRFEGEARFAAAAWPSDNGQFSKRKIDINSLEIVLACTANFNTAALRRSSNVFFFSSLRTHWR